MGYGWSVGERVRGTAAGLEREDANLLFSSQRRLRGWRLTARFIEGRRAARLRYTELYKRAQGKPWHTALKEDEAAELVTLEKDVLSVDDILQFRGFAQVQLHAEEDAHKSAQPAPTPPTKSWYGWLTGSRPEEVPSSVDVAGQIELSSEQRQILASLLTGSADAGGAGMATASAE